jgi:hypothetical protein
MILTHLPTKTHIFSSFGACLLRALFAPSLYLILLTMGFATSSATTYLGMLFKVLQTTTRNNNSKKDVDEPINMAYQEPYRSILFDYTL